MPSKTKRQARAMRAAAAGRSNIGIPQDVGEEFVKADMAKKKKKVKKKRAPMKKLPPKTPSKRPRVKRLPRAKPTKKY